MSGPGPELDAFVERYVSVYNEPDAAVRRRMIEDLWTPDGANFTKSNEWRGYEALEARVRDAHEKWGGKEDVYSGRAVRTVTTVQFGSFGRWCPSPMAE